MALLDCPNALNPDPGAMICTIFDKGLDGHQNHVFSFSQIYIGVEKIFKDFKTFSLHFHHPMALTSDPDAMTSTFW